MSSMHTMNQHGDTVTQWDATDTSRAGRAAVCEAERIFAAARASGMSAFRVTGPGETARLDTFDPTAPRIVLVPRLIGG